MRNFFKAFGMIWISHVAHAGIIYGVDHVQHQSRHVHYPVYVQMGSFSTIRAAERLKHQVPVVVRTPTFIQSSHGRYNVVAGPFRDQASLNGFANQMMNSTHPLQSKSQPHAHVVHESRHHTSSTSVHGTPVLSKQYSVPFRVVQEGSHPEVSVFLGGSYIPNTIKGQTLQLLPYEVGEYADTFTHQSDATAFTWGVDASYRFKLHAPSVQSYVVDSLGVGVDFFQITNFEQTGKVLQFNMPEFENYNDTLKLNNLRVMANFDLDFHPVMQHLTPFIQGGVGSARTEISYHSTPISPVDSPNFTLPNEASWHFAYQAGAGVKYVAQEHLILSLRYLYANMGKVNSSTSGDTATLATSLTANMSTQNLLFGLTYAMG